MRRVVLIAAICAAVAMLAVLVDRGSLATLGLRRLARSGRPRLALLWASALAAGFAIELAAKAAVHQQQPDHRVICRGLGAGGFDASFPSGHALRAVLLAGIGAALWPHLQRRFVLSALAVALALQVNGIHPLSDIVAGLLTGAALWLAVTAVNRRLGPEPQPAGQSDVAAAVRPASA
jgi:membrane-associated phospholipid phosphatase